MATTYKAYPTMQRFHADYNNFFNRFVAGPPGSGKSVGSALELVSIGLRQEPTPDGIRPTKFAVIRSTYGELERTTLETLRQWLPAQFTKITRSKPITVHCRLPLPDKTIADMRFELIAIENYFDLGKLDSYEATAIWLNEMTGLPKELVGKAGERVGRYPPANMWDDGENHCTFYGVIGDYNYPPKDHWLVEYLHSGTMPPNTMLYEQPPALIEVIDSETGETTYTINPYAENLSNLDGGQKYMKDLATYQRMGLWDMIQTRLLCRYGRAGGDGKKVFTNFDPSFHVAPEALSPAKLTDCLISIDTSGIHPCALIWQHVRSKWQIADGIYGEEMGLEEFIDDVLTPLLTMRYAECNYLCVCDPANARDARTAITPIDLLREKGYDAIPATTNRFKERLQASEILLNRREKGAVSISPALGELVDAMDGGYQYRKLKVGGLNTVFSAQPEKNKYSHWADAFQYGALHITSSVLSDDLTEKARRLASRSFIRSRA